MKTSELIELFGTMNAVARFFNIQRQAVHQWGDTVPMLRQYQIREKRPKIDKELKELAGRRKGEKKRA